jgi:N-acetylmuramoyl-L-alanine amidase
MKIAINGGHYPGRDSGSVGSTGLQEANVNRDMMTRVASYLRAVGYEVLEVQENILNKITVASNQFNADLFVAIHCNSFSDIEVKGTETYCYTLGGESEQLGICIQRQIVNSLGMDDRGVKTGNFYVLRLTNCPAVLVEMAFISNPEEERLLADEDMCDQFAAAIARGITDYYTGV